MDTLTRFRVLIALTEQLGFHFAKVCEAVSDQRRQTSFGFKFFGGKFKTEVIRADSSIVAYLLESDNWNELFGDTLEVKFPYLFQSV